MAVRKSSTSRPARTVTPKPVTPRPKAAPKPSAKETVGKILSQRPVVQRPGVAPKTSKAPRPAATAEQMASRDRVKAMAERGWQRYSQKNPSATRADYRAYARQRVSEMAARAKSRKRGA